MYFFKKNYLCKYDFYLKDLIICNLKIFKCIFFFEKKIFLSFLRKKTCLFNIEKTPRV